MSLAFTICFLASTFGIFASYLIFYHARCQAEVPQKLLSLIVLSFSWILLVATFNFSGFIAELPHFFRTALPFCLIIPPTCYLYVRTFFEQEKKFKKMDMLHFTPAFLLFLNLLPFYLQSSEAKKSFVSAYIEHPETLLHLQGGVIPSFLIYLAIGISAGLYLFLQIKMIYKTMKATQLPMALTINEGQYKWLISLTACILLVYLALIWAFAMKMETHESIDNVALVMGGLFMVFMIFLYQKPEMLYNLSTTIQRTEPQHAYIPFDKDQLKEYCQRVLDFIETEKPYLQSGYSLENLANDTCISRSHLSIVINRGLGAKYNNLINEYRVKYLMSHYTEVNKHNLTMEGIASEVGFKSRTTFLHSVKKITGLTPTEFIKKLKTDELVF